MWLNNERTRIPILALKNQYAVERREKENNKFSVKTMPIHQMWLNEEIRRMIKPVQSHADSSIAKRRDKGYKRTIF